MVLTPERALDALLGPEWAAGLTTEQRGQIKAADWVYIAVSTQDYENLARSLADVLRWVEEANWQLGQCYDTLGPDR